MKLLEKINEHRYDFTGILECEHCGSKQFMHNGYADANFYDNVIPAIKCVACDKRGVEVVPDGISDPGYQGGFKVKKVIVEVEEREKA